MNNSVSYLTLFKTFLKIGIVTFGGGYAMIPIIESEVVDKHHWMTKEEFLDAIATTQVCPGALAINMSSLLGYKLAKMPHWERAIFPLQNAWDPADRRNDEVTPWIEAFVNARQWIEERALKK